MTVLGAAFAPAGPDPNGRFWEKAAIRGPMISNTCNLILNSVSAEQVVLSMPYEP